MLKKLVRIRLAFIASLFNGGFMNLNKIYEIASDEANCLKFLINSNIIKTFNNCIKCGEKNISLIKSDFYRCHNCKKEWSIKTFSFLSGRKITYGNFIKCLKLFSMGVSAKTCSLEISIGLKQVNLFYEIFRTSIFIMENGYNINDESILKGQINIYICMVDSKIKISTSNQNSNKIIMNRTKLHETTFRPKIHLSCNKSDPIYPILLNFWYYTKSKLMNYKGNSYKGLLLIIQELMLRYNLKEELLFTTILHCLSKTKVA